MISPSQIDLVIYHRNCPDGFGAAFAAWRRNPEIEFVSASYGDKPPDVSGRSVAILDFSYPREVLEEMRLSAKALIVLDHHKSAQKDLDGFPGAVFDMEQSGAAMAWKWFHQDSTPKTHEEAVMADTELPVLIQYIQDRDLWKFLLPDSKAFSKALAQVKVEFKAWGKAFELTSTPEGLREFTALGSVIENLIAQENGTLAKRAMPITLRGVELLALNYNGLHHSDMGHTLCEYVPHGRHTPLGASLTWHYAMDAKVFRCSLRSSEDGPEILELAESFGGGGHPHAAGFEFYGDIRDLLSGAV